MNFIVSVLLAGTAMVGYVHASDVEDSQNIVIRVSANSHINLKEVPGTLNIVDCITRDDIGIVAKDKQNEPRIDVHPHYVLDQRHRDGIALGIRYDVEGLKGEVYPVHFYFNNVPCETCPLFSKNNKNSLDNSSQTELEILPLAAIRVNLMENIVIGGGSPYRASAFVRYGKNTKPIKKFVGPVLDTPNTFLNDNLIFDEVIKNAPLSIPVAIPSISGYKEAAEQSDFHKGQLYVMNEYLRLAEEKYNKRLDKSNPEECHYFLNYFITKGIVQTNEQRKYAEEFDLTLDSLPSQKN